MVIDSPGAAASDAVAAVLAQAGRGQIVVPVGMSDLLDDWLYSPDAARWEPMALGADSEAFAALPDPDALQYRMTLWVNEQAFEAAFRSLVENAVLATESFERFKLGAVPTMELLDEAPVDEMPTDVRGRSLWLRQHRNTGPDDRFRWTRRH